jgi:glucose-6-phosphate 1-dehydrogenase
MSSDQVENTVLSKEEKKQHLSIIVLGASGDLAKKKTYPALFALYSNNLLPPNTVIYGYARSEMDDAKFRQNMEPRLKGSGDKKKFLDLLHYQHGGYDSAESFAKLSETLKKHEGDHGNRIFYFAIPPSVFVPSAQAIKASGLTTTGWNRIIVEKPFGRDLESSSKLAKDLSKLFTEDQLYRIDHYLGKEMVQNLMVLRFANNVFDPLFNRNHIASVSITFKEDIGTEGRGGYFDEFGIIRDVMQNHLVQILALFAMEAPVTLEAADVQAEKVKLLKAIPPITRNNVVVGQYTASPDGKNPGYLEDKTVPQGSTCPTFATAVAFVNNARWKGVPFILKCGKALNERKTEVRVQFQAPAYHLFNDPQSNELVIRVQPNEAIYLKMTQKKPGLNNEQVQAELDLTYKERFGLNLNLPDAYERLILDVIRGDHNLFVRDDELEASWKIFTPILHELEKNKEAPISYPFGSRGPAEADELAQKYGFRRTEGYTWPGPKM